MHNQASSDQGIVIRVSGTIIDVQFPQESAPEILTELLIKIPHQN